MASYRDDTKAQIHLQCDRRGIPPEEEGSVRQFLAEKTGGDAFDELNYEQLKSVNQNMGVWMREYLDGQKRRGGVAPLGPDEDRPGIGETTGDVEA